MKTDRHVVGPATRLAYAFVGLLAGDAVLLVSLLQNAFEARASLLAMHMGEPALQIPHALEVFELYASFSFIGWMMVGLPVALGFPARLVVRLHWAVVAFMGAALGPVALFLIFVLFSRGRVDFGNLGTFTGTRSLWELSVLVSTVAFVVYVALLHRVTSTKSKRRSQL